MGDPIFKFIPNKKPESVPSPLNVFITLMNSVKYFTWNGEDYKKLNFPGVMLRFTISTKDSSGEHILWDKYLDPISKYSSQFVSVKDLYNEMIGSTIHTFSEQI